MKPFFWSCFWYLAGTAIQAAVTEFGTLITVQHLASEWVSYHGEFAEVLFPKEGSRAWQPETGESRLDAMVDEAREQHFTVNDTKLDVESSEKAV